jgi:hypothetical protein
MPKTLYLEGALVNSDSPDERYIEGMFVTGLSVQYPIVFVKATSGIIQLATVGETDAPTGMGGVLKTAKAGTKYAFVLVETTHPKASPVRIKTTTGVKSIRKS